MDLPDDWDVVPDIRPEIALAALAPADASGFRRNVVVAVGPLAAAWRDPMRWQEASVDGLLQVLEDSQLIDMALEPDGFRQLISYVGEGRALTLEQWAWRWDDNEISRGVTVSATTPTSDYSDQADQTAAVATGWRPTGAWR